jgi:serine/threonine protein kinase/tetratricopeptide (TPR) repeat protein
VDDRTPKSPIPPTPDNHRRPNLSTLDHLDLPRGLSSPSSLVHETLGPFEVHEVIGRGGMGIVLSGMHLEQRVPVAIKAVTGYGKVDARLRRRLRNEVQAVAALNHPGIVMVFDHGEVDHPEALLQDDTLDAGTPYFVMELTQRSTLRDVSGRLSWRQSKAILLTLLDALAHAHAAGVIHRDIKPENILLARWGGRLIPKLADFGIAYAVEGGSATAQCIGTPRYMAPEQINQPWRTHGAWSDLYSLGCVAFELLSGKELFEGTDLVNIYQQHFRPRHPRLDPVVTVLPGFQRWLDKMLSRDLDERFQTAADAARALAMIDDEGVADVAPSNASAYEFLQLTPVLDPLLAVSVAQAGSWSAGSSSAGSSSAGSSSAGSAMASLKSRHKPPSVVEQLGEAWPRPSAEPMSIRIVGTGLGVYGLRAIPLVGRESELERMWHTLLDVERTSDNRTLVVRGTQGSGKSRLIEWFTQRLKEFGAAHVLRATHSAEGGPADGLSAMLARHFRTQGASDSETEKIIREAMGEAANEADYEWQTMTRIVRPTLGEEAVSSGVQIASPAQRYAVIRRYLRALAGEKPVIIWCDDAHWGGDAIEFARFLDRVQPNDAGPVLLVLAVSDDALAERDDERELLAKLVEHDQVEELVLEPLDTVKHERLVHELLLLEGDLARDVVRRTAGNPLFAVDLIGEWVQRGVLEVGAQGFVLRDGVEPTIPDHLHDMWVQRIEGLLGDYDDDARHALELAAALGQDVQIEEWEGVCDLAGVYLDESLAAHLIERRFARRTESGWAFAHAIVRESIERLARDGGRWGGHRRICATLIDALYDTSRPQVAERYGRYAMSAHQYLQALEPLLCGARGRRSLGEYRAAQHLLASYVRCLELMEAPGEDYRWGEAWVMRARTYLNSGQPKDARRWAEKALEASNDHGWDDIRPQAMCWLALAKQWLGEKDAAEFLRRAYALLKEAPIERAMRGAYGSVAHGLTRLGDFEEAERLLERDFAAGERKDDEHAVANNYYLRCRLAAFRQQWQSALEHGETALRMMQALGHLPGVGLCMELMAEVQRLLGNTERAEDVYRECIALQETIGYPTTIAQMNLASILLKRGRIREAEQLFMLSTTAFDASGRRLFHTVALAGLLACASAQKCWDAASDHLEPIHAFLTENEACERDLAELLEFAADHLRDGGQFRDAVAVYTLAVQQWQRLGDDERIDAVMKKISRWT